MQMAGIAGGDEFNKEKFKQVLHHIIARCEDIESAGKTVLFKLPYFSEFNYYELYEEKITGETYRRIDHGPAPLHFNLAIGELESEGKINHFDKDFHGKPQIKYKSLIEPEIDLLTAREMAVINAVIEKHGYMNATEISDLSHMDVPYMATKEKCLIDYELVFYRDPITSVRVYEPDD
jgi:uncharacterized phage-associated protein